MVSKKKEPEGIALLSIYGDEDDDMEEEEDEDFAPELDPENPLQQTVNEMEADSGATINTDRIPNFESLSANDKIDSSTPPIFIDSSTPKLHSSSTSKPISLDSGRSITERPTIVDYGHDEAALSPEAEEGEIAGTGRVMFGEGLHMSNGEFLEQTSKRTLLTSSIQATPQSSGKHSLLQLEGMECTVTESIYVEEAVKVSLEEPKDIDPLDKFLLPPPTVKCSDELQEKIIKFLSLKTTTGRSFNAEVRNRKDYRNPDFLLHSVTYQDIDQIGTCFGEDVFNPHGYDKSDYYDEIEANMKREMERKEQEKKKNQKIEYISGGTQLGAVVSTPKINMPIPGVSSMAGGGLLSVPAPVDTVVRDGRPNKKSKWDKVFTFYVCTNMLFPSIFLKIYEVLVTQGVKWSEPSYKCLLIHRSWFNTLQRQCRYGKSPFWLEKRTPCDGSIYLGQPTYSLLWDYLVRVVDGDQRNSLPTGGQDSVSAAMLSAANAGTGYTAFAQQRRREAEEKRSSDKKLHRRS